MNRILITGASRGIGRAIALELASSETYLILHGRDKKALDETAKLVEAKGSQTESIIADLSQLDEVAKLAETVSEKPLDCLINNAGVAVNHPIEGHSIDDLQFVMNVNLIAPFILTGKLLPHMTSGSSIVNILSIASHTGFPEWGAYCASKFAMEGFSQSLREEVRSNGIRVLNVYPGSVATDIWNSVSGDHDPEKMMPPEAVAKSVAHTLSLPLSVTAESITLTNLGGTL